MLNTRKCVPFDTSIQLLSLSVTNETAAYGEPYSVVLAEVYANSGNSRMLTPETSADA